MQLSVKRFRHTLYWLILAISASSTADDGLLRVEQAFKYTVSATHENLTIQWDIEPGYYLYKSRMGYSTESDGITLGEPVMGKGKMKDDEFFGRQETFWNALKVVIPYTRTPTSDNLTLKLKLQGCDEERGICYPPQRWEANVALPKLLATKNTGVTGGGSGSLLDALANSAQFGSGSDAFLSPDDAFRVSAIMLDDYTLMLRWEIEDGYYLYKEQLGVTGESSLIQLGNVQWPDGEKKHDEYFGDVEVFYMTAETQVPVSRANAGAGTVTLTADYQGCAENGICYPPDSRQLTLVIDPARGTAGGSSSAALVKTSAAMSNRTAGITPKISEQDKLANLIGTGSLPAVIATFFGLGLLLAFTPCVLPMVPILSGIIGGQKEPLTVRRSFMLSLVYVLAMALTYTIIGVIVAMLGKNVQAFFQNPYVLVGFSFIFVALALAMFDIWQFQVPAAIQSKLSQAGSGGGYFGVGVMGVLSALIVGPCVAAPLVAALIFIGQSGDEFRGGITLFALSIGMGTPLLIYGATAGQLMIRAGAWMDVVKKLFGVMLIGVAIWMLARILPPQITMFLWSALALMTAWVLGIFRKPNLLVFRAAAIVCAAYGLGLAASAVSGGHDPISLLRGTPWGPQEHHMEFRLIKTVDDLNAAVRDASSQGKNTMLDFYADWCVSCKEMEKYTFTQANVQAALQNTVVLQADVTKNDDEDKALLEHFDIYGPPTIAFFDRAGNERRNFRVVGFMPADEFAAHSQQAVAQ